MPSQQHNQHRVLLGNNPQQMQFPVGMGSGPSLGSGMIRAVQGQHLYQQQLVPQQFPFSVPPPQKKKSRPIKIIDPDTNVEVAVHSIGSSALTDRTNAGEQSEFNVVAAEFKHIVTAVSSSIYQPPVNTEPVSGIL